MFLIDNLHVRYVPIEKGVGVCESRRPSLYIHFVHQIEKCHVQVLVAHMISPDDFSNVRFKISGCSSKDGTESILNKEKTLK
jgi:hypothetical protein